MPDLYSLNLYFAEVMPSAYPIHSVGKLSGGQSNPTYRLKNRDGSLVLRQKPAGRLLESAHAVEREFQGVYSMTKAAVVNMSHAVAKECAGMNIRVNAVLPGFTKTTFSGALFEDEKTYQSVIRMIPMQRHAEPEEIAGTVLYLASDASSYTTGTSIAVDGGLLA